MSFGKVVHEQITAGKSQGKRVTVMLNSAYAQEVIHSTEHSLTLGKPDQDGGTEIVNTNLLPRVQFTTDGRIGN